MTVTEVLQLMEDVIFKHTGKHLDDLQRNAISGIWQYQTYREIADEFKYDEEYIGKISRDLYELLSKKLKEVGKNEKVKKSNFVTKIERVANLYN